MESSDEWSVGEQMLNIERAGLYISGNLKILNSISHGVSSWGINLDWDKGVSLDLYITLDMVRALLTGYKLALLVDDFRLVDFVRMLLDRAIESVVFLL